MTYMHNDNGPVRGHPDGHIGGFRQRTSKKGKNRNGLKFMFLRLPVSKKVYCLLCNWRQELEKSNDIYD